MATRAYEKPMANAKQFGPTHRSDNDRVDGCVTRVEYREDLAGWYVCRYPSPIALTQGNACAIVGPYETQAQAVRILNSARPAGADDPLVDVA